MSDANAPFELTMTRFIRAPRERVYAAFVEPELLSAWKCPRGMRVTACSTDPRVGGAWRMTMAARDGSTFAVGGVYEELSPPARLVHTWIWEQGPMAGASTRIEVTLREEGGGTRLELRHSGFPAAPSRDAHGTGWDRTLVRLADLLDPRGSAASVTLHGLAPSSYTRTARLALAEKGVAYTFREVPPHGPEVLALNPFGRVPVLTDGELVVYETSAIARFVDDSFDGPPLVPGVMGERARCEQWVSVFNSSFYEAVVSRYVRPTLFPSGADGRPDRSITGPALEAMPGLLAIVEQGYAKAPWLAGESLSLADLFFMPVFAYLERLAESRRLLEATPQIRRALQAMQARPSFSATEPNLGPP